MADRPNLRHVAAVAGVSHMTVSRVLSGHPNIKESTRQRVLEAVDELDYRPNIAARSLVTQRTDRIGVMVESGAEFGPSSTLRAIERAAREKGYSVTSVALRDDQRHDARSTRSTTSSGLGHRRALRDRAALLLGRDAAHRRDRRADPRRQVRQGPDLPHRLGRPAGGHDARPSTTSPRSATATCCTCPARSTGSTPGPASAPSTRGRRRGACASGPIVVGDWTPDFGYDFATQPALGARLHRDGRRQRRDGARSDPRTRRARHPRARGRQRRRLRRPAHRAALPAAAHHGAAGLRRARRRPSPR